MGGSALSMPSWADFWFGGAPFLRSGLNRSRAPRAGAVKGGLRFVGHRARRPARSVLDGGEHGAKPGQVGRFAPGCRAGTHPTSDSEEPEKALVPS